jgi:hypothetical protein
MYILIKDGNIEKYPYSINQLKQDNKNVSFPINISNEILAEFGVYPVISTEYPQVDYTKNVVEKPPLKQRARNIDGTYKADDDKTIEDEAWEWVQVYEVTDATEQEIASRILELNVQAKINRAEAYRNESDPLFFKWQRGEASEQEWLDKISEIKARYPDIV